MLHTWHEYHSRVMPIHRVIHRRGYMRWEDGGFTWRGTVPIASLVSRSRTRVRTYLSQVRSIQEQGLTKYIAKDQCASQRQYEFSTPALGCPLPGTSTTCSWGGRKLGCRRSGILMGGIEGKDSTSRYYRLPVFPLLSHSIKSLICV